MGQTSSDAELSDWGRKQTEFLSNIASSKEFTDKRLFQIFELRLAERAA